METNMPPALLGLPSPWCLLAKEDFDIAIREHPRTEANMMGALEVLRRATDAALRTTWDEVTEVADEIHWGPIIADVNQRIGRIDNYHRDFFVDVFEYGADRKGTPSEVDCLAAQWVWGVAPRVFRRALDWIVPSLRDAPESAVAHAYRNFVRDRWKYIKENNASNLVSYLALVRCPETEELLQEIDNHPDVTPDLKRAVMGVRSNWKEQDYYKANPHLLYQW